MAHYVIISSEFITTPSTNGLCDDAIAQELSIRGNTVEVICYGKENVYKFKKENNITIHTIKEENFCDYNKLRRLISRVIALFLYPIKHPIYVYRFYNMFKQVVSNYSIDYVLASQMPAETVMAVRKIKRHYSTIKVGIYALDLLSNSLIDQDGWRRILQKKGKIIENKNMEITDFVFCLECNKCFVQSSNLNKFTKKIQFVDIPLISKIRYESIEKHRPLENRESERPICFIYSGTLLKGYREPTYILELIKMINTDIPCRIDFYSKGSYERTLLALSEKLEYVNYRGFIPQQILDIKLAESDILLSIGNSHTESFTGIPSKIFTYMSTGKPIIHILGGKNDACQAYFSYYPDVLILDPEDDITVNTERMKKFINMKRDTKVSFQQLATALMKNTPKYSVDIIEKTFQNN